MAPRFRAPKPSSPERRVYAVKLDGGITLYIECDQHGKASGPQLSSGRPTGFDCYIPGEVKMIVVRRDVPPYEQLAFSLGEKTGAEVVHEENS